MHAIPRHSNHEPQAIPGTVTPHCQNPNRPQTPTTKLPLATKPRPADNQTRAARTPSNTGSDQMMQPNHSHAPNTHRENETTPAAPAPQTAPTPSQQVRQTQNPREPGPAGAVQHRSSNQHATPHAAAHAENTTGPQRNEVHLESAATVEPGQEPTNTREPRPRHQNPAETATKTTPRTTHSHSQHLNHTHTRAHAQHSQHHQDRNTVPEQHQHRSRHHNRDHARRHGATPHPTAPRHAASHAHPDLNQLPHAWRQNGTPAQPGPPVLERNPETPARNRNRTTNSNHTTADRIRPNTDRKTPNAAHPHQRLRGHRADTTNPIPATSDAIADKQPLHARAKTSSIKAHRSRHILPQTSDTRGRDRTAPAGPINTAPNENTHSEHPPPNHGRNTKASPNHPRSPRAKHRTHQPPSSHHRGIDRRSNPANKDATKVHIGPHIDHAGSNQPRQQQITHRREIPTEPYPTNRGRTTNTGDPTERDPGATTRQNHALPNHKPALKPRPSTRQQTHQHANTHSKLAHSHRKNSRKPATPGQPDPHRNQGTIRHEAGRAETRIRRQPAEINAPRPADQSARIHTDHHTTAGHTAHSTAASAHHSTTAVQRHATLDTSTNHRRRPPQARNAPTRQGRAQHNTANNITLHESQQPSRHQHDTQPRHTKTREPRPTQHRKPLMMTAEHDASAKKTSPGKPPRTSGEHPRTTTNPRQENDRNAHPALSDLPIRPPNEAETRKEGRNGNQANHTDARAIRTPDRAHTTGSSPAHHPHPQTSTPANKSTSTNGRETTREPKPRQNSARAHKPPHRAGTKEILEHADNRRDADNNPPQHTSAPADAETPPHSKTDTHHAKTKQAPPHPAHAAQATGAQMVDSSAKTADLTQLKQHMNNSHHASPRKNDPTPATTANHTARETHPAHDKHIVASRQEKQNAEHVPHRIPAPQPARPHHARNRDNPPQPARDPSQKKQNPQATTRPPDLGTNPTHRPNARDTHPIQHPPRQASKAITDNTPTPPTHNALRQQPTHQTSVRHPHGRNAAMRQPPKTTPPNNPTANDNNPSTSANIEQHTPNAHASSDHRHPPAPSRHGKPSEFEKSADDHNATQNQATQQKRPTQRAETVKTQEDPLPKIERKSDPTTAIRKNARKTNQDKRTARETPRPTDEQHARPPRQQQQQHTISTDHEKNDRHAQQRQRPQPHSPRRDRPHHRGTPRARPPRQHQPQDHTQPGRTRHATNPESSHRQQRSPQARPNRPDRHRTPTTHHPQNRRKSRTHPQKTPPSGSAGPRQKSPRENQTPSQHRRHPQQHETPPKGPPETPPGGTTNRQAPPRSRDEQPATKHPPTQHEAPDQNPASPTAARPTRKQQAQAPPHPTPTRPQPTASADPTASAAAPAPPHGKPASTNPNMPPPARTPTPRTQPTTWRTPT